MIGQLRVVRTHPLCQAKSGVQVNRSRLASSRRCAQDAADDLVLACVTAGSIDNESQGTTLTSLQGGASLSDSIRSQRKKY